MTLRVRGALDGRTASHRVSITDQHVSAGACSHLSLANQRRRVVRRRLSP